VIGMDLLRKGYTLRSVKQISVALALVGFALPGLVGCSDEKPMKVQASDVQLHGLPAPAAPGGGGGSKPAGGKTAGGAPNSQ